MGTKIDPLEGPKRKTRRFIKKKKERREEGPIGRAKRKKGGPTWTMLAEALILFGVR